MDMSTLTSLLPEKSDHKLMEDQCWIRTLQAVIKKVQDTDIQLEEGPLDYQHMNCLQNIVNMIAAVPLCLPRYFFQSQQATSIKVCAKACIIKV